MPQEHISDGLYDSSKEIEAKKAEFDRYTGMMHVHSAYRNRNNIGMLFYTVLTSTATYMTFTQLTHDGSFPKVVAGTIASGLALLLAMKNVVVADYHNGQVKKADKEAKRLLNEIRAIANADSARNGSKPDSLDEIVID